MYGRSTVRHRDRAVGVLVVLHHRDQRAADGDAGTVERVHQLGLAGRRIAPARLHAPGLEIARSWSTTRSRGRLSCEGSQTSRS